MDHLGPWVLWQGYTPFKRRDNGFESHTGYSSKSKRLSANNIVGVTHPACSLARVVELADTTVSNTVAERYVGSNPTLGTMDNEKTAGVVAENLDGPGVNVKIGSHVTNGKTNYVVHVTHEVNSDGSRRSAYTVS